ncbi:hypothetical protein AB395_00002147 [Sinorhizobium fredii CCBAU 45436]|nr:hypothetical protein AB395_00002147 [Sinorhizobium fredii CCBAU 45436]
MLFLQPPPKGSRDVRDISRARLTKCRFGVEALCVGRFSLTATAGTATRVNQSKRFINHNVVVVALRGDLATRAVGNSQTQASFAIVAYCLGV